MTSIRLALALTLLVLHPGIVAQPSDALIGTYRIEGSQDGDTYTGLAAIDAFEGSVYAITWQIDGGDAPLYGVLMQKGDALSVIFSLAGHTCFAVYTRAGDKWIGQWTCQGLEGKLHAETLIRAVKA